MANKNLNRFFYLQLGERKKIITKVTKVNGVSCEQCKSASANQMINSLV